MIESKRRNNVELAQTKYVLHEKRLVIRSTTLVQTLYSRGGISRSVRIEVDKLRERRITLIDDAAKSQRAAFEHGAVAPEFAEPQVNATVSVILILNDRHATCIQFLIGSP